jgi:hypothetical protein
MTTPLYIRMVLQSLNAPFTAEDLDGIPDDELQERNEIRSKRLAREGAPCCTVQNSDRT